jgi:predicted ATPase/transcriptional regulator with XRE-family HTH domain
MDIQVSFGGWIAERRKALDLTRDQLAGRVGCSASALRKIESDERRPSRQMAERLAECLQVLPDQRLTFLQVARGVLRVERLGTPLPASAPVRARPTLHRPGSNLPTPLTPLVGREPELVALTRLLRDPQCRLLTLVGPGGIGKTRLALEVACAQQAVFADGTFFVSLASTGSPEFIAPAIAEAVGLTFSGPTEPRVQLMNYLCGKHILLLLDNLEHLLEGVGLFTQILECAPESKLLATSRERLDLHGEWVFEVQGLPAPADDQVEGLESYSAVALFLHSARRTRMNFQLTPTERPFLIRICQLVEGMPLGIELAAAWVRVLSCQEIAQEIERNLDFLAMSMRDVPERHRSMRAVFDQSWRMLSAQEQQVLRRLSVLRGGFGREAAEQIAGATLSLLSALVTKSLVRRHAAGRYDLHELIRRYACERLHESGETEATRLHHARFFLEFAEIAEPHMFTNQAPLWLNRLEQEHDNLREVLSWALEPAEGPAASQRIAVGLRMATAMANFWFLRGHQREGLARLRELLARSETAEPNQGRMEMLTWAGYLLWAQGHLAQARVILEEALTISEAIGDRKYLALVLEHLGLVTIGQGDYESARAHFEQSLGVWRELKAGFRIAAALSALGDIALLQEDRERAEKYYTQAAAPTTEVGYTVQHPYPLRRLAYGALQRGDCAKAIRLCQASLWLNREMVDRRGMAACIVVLASVASTQGQLVRAAQLFGAAEAILSSIAAPLLPADQREYERYVGALRGQLGQAELAAAWAEGCSMTIEQAVAFALNGA